MATNGFTVTTEKLDEAAQQIKDRTAQYASDIQKLYMELEAMTANQWKGVASETLRAKIEGYREEFEKLRTCLEQYADNVLTKSKNYSATEDSITSAAQSI